MVVSADGSAEGACEICGCRESQGHVDPFKMDESFKLENSRALLRARNTTQHIRNRVLVTGNGFTDAQVMGSFASFNKRLEEAQMRFEDEPTPDEPAPEPEPAPDDGGE